MLHLFLTIIAGIVALVLLFTFAPLLLILAGIAAFCMGQVGWGIGLIIAGAVWAHGINPKD